MIWIIASTKPDHIMKVHLAYVLTSIFSIFVQQVAQEVESSDLAEAH